LVWAKPCIKLIRPFLWSGDALHQTEYTQPALFAFEYSLAKLFEEWGVIPDLLLGHSIGEYAAACIADVFSLEEGIRLVSARGRLMQSLPTGGQMVSVATDEVTVREAIGSDKNVSVAAVNGPQSIVVSGDGSAVESVVERLSSNGVKTTALKVSHAFHSPMMDPILDEFRSIASTVNFNAPTKTIVSNVTGMPWTDEQLTPDYWVDHLRGAVRFADGINYAQLKKIQTFVEIGPRPTLLGLGRRCVASDYGTWLPGVKPDAEWSTLLSTLSELYVRGVGVNWQQFYESRGTASLGGKLLLPNYPWRYQRCWTDVLTTGGDSIRIHPLINRRIENASSNIIFESTVSSESPAYLSDHRIFGNVVFPGSAFFEMAMVAARNVFKQDNVAITNVSIERALVLTEVPTTVQMVATPNADRFDFAISSRSSDDEDSDWVSHTTGTLEIRSPGDVSSIDIQQTLAGYTESVNVNELNKRAENIGLEYLSRFQAIAEIHTAPSISGDDTRSAFARIELPAEAVLPGDSYQLHPVIIDASFRIDGALFPDDDVEHIYLPFGISEFSCTQAAGDTIWVKATGRQQNKTRIIDLELFNEDGLRIAVIENFTLRSVPVFSLQRALTKPRASKDVLSEWLYEFTWEEDSEDAEAITDNTDNDKWLLLSDAQGIAAELMHRMEQQGHEVRVAKSIGEFDALIKANKAQDIKGIVHLWGMDASEAEPDAALLNSLQVVQSLSRAGIAARHWLVTKGAQAVKAQEQVSPWQTQYWGFGRTLQVEHSELMGACIDLDASVNTEINIDSLLTVLGKTNSATELAFRHGKRYVARLTRPEPIGETQQPLALDKEGSYLITGGVGAIGLQVATYLASSGAGHLILTGRSGVSTDDQRSALQAIEATGVKVNVVSADIGNADDVARVLAPAPRLRGIVHAAGVLDDGMLMQQNADRFKRVAAPKVHGAWHLHSQTLNQTLDFFVLFSSVASVIGSSGQSNYASANAFMDGLAHFRKQQGLAATSINWGPWADVGMAASDVVLRRLMNDGWQAMTTSQGCEFISHLLNARDLAQAAVIPVDWGTFVQRIPGAAEWSTIKHLIPSNATTGSTKNAADSAAQRVKAATSSERIELISAYLLERVAQTLRVAATDLDELAALSDLGIDSLTVVELRSWVRSDLDVELSVEQMFTTPSIKELGVAIDAMLGGSASVDTGSDQPITEASDWVVQPMPRPEARMRLICFPYAGGGASAFFDWPKLVPDDVELCIVQLPGRESRLREPLLTDMVEVVDKVANELLAFTDRPFAFVGHSMGAIVCFEVARRLRELGATIPKQLFLSARGAPQLQESSEPLRFLENDEFIERLGAMYGAVPDAIRQSVELQNVFVPILRADVALLETYKYSIGEPLACPVTVLGGSGDPAISPNMLAGWQELTSAAFAQHEYAGEHFFIHTARDAVVSTIVNGLL